MWGPSSVRKKARESALELDAGSLVEVRGLTRQALQFLAGLEAHRLAGWDVHFFAGTRIAADARFPRLYGEHAKSAQLNALAAAHSVLQRFKNRFDGLLGFYAAHARSFELFQYGVYNVQFNQARPPLQTVLQLAGRSCITVGRC